MTAMGLFRRRSTRTRPAEAAPTPQDTDDLIDDMRAASRRLVDVTDRLCHLAEDVLPNDIIPKLTRGGASADGTSRGPDPGSAGAEAADRAARAAVPDGSDRRTHW